MNRINAIVFEWVFEATNFNYNNQFSYYMYFLNCSCIVTILLKPSQSMFTVAKKL